MPELARIEAVTVLQSVDFFSSCTAEEVLRIAAIAQERKAAAGEELFREREPADMLYAVVRGEVEVRARDGSTETVGPLQTLGLLSLLSGRLYDRTAVAKVPTLVLAVDGDDFFDLLSNNIDMVKSLFRHLVGRVDGRAIAGGL